MLTIRDVMNYLEAFAPTALAESWDNVGLLAGDSARPVTRLMTCLTITPESAAEAIAERAELIVAHHPLPFRPVARLTTDTPTGKILWDLLGARVAIYSPHTAFDSAARGINQRLAEGVGLESIKPLIPLVIGDNAEQGGGRWGRLAKPLALTELASRLKQFLRIEHVQSVGDPKRPVSSVAVACGSGGEFLEAAQQAGCEVLVTGEARFHGALEAEARGMALLLPGHFASERFGVERLAEALSEEFPALRVWASRAERDPLCWL